MRRWKQRDKIQVCLARKVRCRHKNKTNIIANFKPIIYILGKTGEAVATQNPLSRRVLMTSQDLIVRLKKPPPNTNKVAAKRHDYAIAVGPLVQFHRITGML